jgi:hypothetical protein
MTNDSLQSKVYNWLLKTGFPLEMRTARNIYQDDRLNEWDMFAGREYMDDRTGEVRESDIRAFSWWGVKDAVSGIELSAWADVIIECKSTSSPWVILRDPMDLPGDHRPLIDFGHRNLYEIRCEQDKDQILQLVNRFAYAFNERQYRHRPSGYGLIEALKEPGGKNSAYHAVQQILSASRNIAEEFFGRAFEGPAFYCAVPVIVTTAPLFEASLTEGSGELLLEPIEWGSVLTIDSRRFNCRVTIVNESALPKLQDDMANWVLVAPDALKTIDLSAVPFQSDRTFRPFYSWRRLRERE